MVLTYFTLFLSFHFLFNVETNSYSGVFTILPSSPSIDSPASSHDSSSPSTDSSSLPTTTTEAFPTAAYTFAPISTTTPTEQLESLETKKPVQTMKVNVSGVGKLDKSWIGAVVSLVVGLLVLRKRTFIRLLF